MISAIGLCMVILAIIIVRAYETTIVSMSYWFITFVVILFYVGLGFLLSSVFMLLLRYAP